MHDDRTMVAEAIFPLSSSALSVGLHRIDGRFQHSAPMTPGV